jgi:hypothetical protein
MSMALLQFAVSLSPVPESFITNPEEALLDMGKQAAEFMSHPITAAKAGWIAFRTTGSASIGKTVQQAGPMAKKIAVPVGIFLAGKDAAEYLQQQAEAGQCGNW